MSVTDSIQEQIAKAKTLGQQGNAEAATAMLGKIIQQDAGNVDVWLALADVVGEPERVEQCLRKVLKLDPGNAIALQKLSSLEGGRVSVGLGHAESLKRQGAPAAADGAEISPQPIGGSIPEGESPALEITGAEGSPAESVPDPELAAPGKLDDTSSKSGPDRLDLVLIGLTVFFALVLCGLLAAVIF